MRIRRFACLLIALALITATASASDLQTAIAQLPDEAVMELFGIVVLEIYHRGLTPETVVQHIDYQMVPSRTPQAADPTHTPGITLQDAVETAYDFLSNQPYTETIVTHTPPATPRPTYSPMAVINDEDTVWVSKSGKRYHTTPDCSGMKSPSGVSLASAKASGRTPCRDCAWWMIPEED